MFKKCIVVFGSLLVVIIGLQNFVQPTIVNAAVCAECKSKAEGADKSAEAHAQQWSGLVIGVNEGARILVITDAPKIDHIKAYPQRTIALTNNTELSRNDAPIDFSAFDIGMRVTATGTYNATKRIITASTVYVGTASAASLPKVAPAPAKISESVFSPSSSGSINRGLKLGSSGASVIALQNLLIKKGFLKLPAGTKLGHFGPSTQAALKKYQTKNGITPLGFVGPQTSQKLLSDLSRS